MNAYNEFISTIYNISSVNNEEIVKYNNDPFYLTLLIVLICLSVWFSFKIRKQNEEYEKLYAKLQEAKRDACYWKDYYDALVREQEMIRMKMNNNNNGCVCSNTSWHKVSIFVVIVIAFMFYIIQQQSC